MCNTLPPLVPSTVRAVKRYSLARLSYLNSLYSGERASDLCTASCHSVRFPTFALGLQRRHFVIGSPETLTMTTSWSSRGSGERKDSASAMLSWSVLDRQKKQSRSACSDSLTLCHPSAYNTQAAGRLLLELFQIQRIQRVLCSWHRSLLQPEQVHHGRFM